jgi:hypothetical protein
MKTVSVVKVVLKLIQEIVNHSELKLFYRGNTVMNRQTVIQEGMQIKTRPYSYRKITKVFITDYKTTEYTTQEIPYQLRKLSKTRLSDGL